MAFTAIFFISAVLALYVSSVPVDSPSNTTNPTSDITWITVTSVIYVFETATQFAMVEPTRTSPVSLLLFIPPPVSLSPISPPSPSLNSMVSHFPSDAVPPPLIFTEKTVQIITDIITVTEAESTTTISAIPSTATAAVTVLPSSSVTAAPSRTTSRTVWAAPAQMTDLSAFNVSAFHGSQENLAIVNGIPASASATTFAIASEPTSTHPGSLPLWDNSSSILQLLYPANSVNPGQKEKPQGGAQFYASPIEIADAQNITLEYSVFFPADFDWVLAGKLPGLYGGHTGCSGGNDALSCFSTRLMWREGGVGELYLYAPKAKQTAALCSHPQSECNTVYGFSIGRGSFTWAAGAWTNVKQTVALNTPGKQDGSFVLDVNGERAINRTDVFYRDVAKPTTTEDGAPGSEKKPPPGGGGLLGPLLNGLFGRDFPEEKRPPLLPLPPPFEELPMTDDTAAALLSAEGLYTASHAVQYEARETHNSQTNILTTAVTITTTTSAAVKTKTAIAGTVTVETFMTATNPPRTVQMQGSTSSKPVGFTGLFFSTFFGGHTDRYATPRDQYVWFKDFKITDNS